MKTIELSNLISGEIKGLWGEDLSDGEKGIKVIKTNNMTYEGFIDYSDICERRIDKADAEKRYLTKGDLLIEKSGGTKTHSVGYINYFDGENNTYLCNNFILALRPNPQKIRPKYLFYALKYLYESGGVKDCFNKTTGIQNLKVPQYLSKKIFVYSTDIQDKIVYFLDKIFSIIKKTELEISYLNEFVKSRFIEMFGDITKSTDGYVKLGSFATISSSKRVHASDYVANGVPFYRSKEIIELGEGKEPSIELFISKEHYEQIKKKNYIPTKGDILMSAVGTIGKMWIVDGKRTFYYKDGNILCIHTELSNPIYLSFALSLLIDIFKDSNVVGSAYSALTIVKLNEMLVPLADISKQNKFAEFVKLIDKSKFAVRKRIDILTELLNKKMEEYFGGDE